MLFIRCGLTLFILRTVVSSWRLSSCVPSDGHPLTSCVDNLFFLHTHHKLNYTVYIFWVADVELKMVSQINT